ncbi:hypothetical protein EYF80_005260 [Liparis tanakae]|uniref:Uncharacterized protein n=1 Tax=Liparis tanakae TaxID=230148 RepID=A0A4Z2J2X4_9TELE|nr:hypothetical protein EYF80_005260 [Liparis tanakae]
MADKQKQGVLPQGYNQGQQQSEKDTLLEDNCSWEGLEIQCCSSALSCGSSTQLYHCADNTVPNSPVGSSVFDVR